MFLAITGGILAGGVALGAIYDFVSGRRGSRVAIGSAGPLNGKTIRADTVHEEYYRR
jgi:hypothetical protein